MKDAYYTAHTSNGEWYTPPDIIERARRVMSGINLDPYTSEVAQRTVQATYYFTAQTDGILSDWPNVRSVWANPPYGKGLIEPCINRLVSEYEQRRYQTAIVLINNATETAWFQRLLQITSAGCMIYRRIDFIDGSGVAKNQNTRGQIALYVGREPDAFEDEFRPLGTCFRCS